MWALGLSSLSSGTLKSQSTVEPYVLWILCTPSWGRKRENEKCEYFCFQARLVQGLCKLLIWETAVLWIVCRCWIKYLKKKSPYLQEEWCYIFTLCDSMNALIKWEIFQALPKRYCKRLLYLFSLKLYLPLSLESLWIKCVFSLLRETKVTLKVNNKVHVSTSI